MKKILSPGFEGLRSQRQEFWKFSTLKKVKIHWPISRWKMNSNQITLYIPKIYGNILHFRENQNSKIWAWPLRGPQICEKYFFIWVLCDFEGVKLGNLTFPPAIFMNDIDNQYEYFKNPKFQNFKTWAWPYNGQFILISFE